MAARDAALAMGDVGEAADPGHHLAERLRPLPRRREGADAPARGAAERPTLRVRAQPHGSFHLRQGLFEQEARVPVGEGVVLDAAVALAVGEHTGADEDAYRRRHVPVGDEVVEDGGDPIFGAAAVLKDHRAGWLVAGPLGGDVQPPVAGRPGEDLAAPVRVGVQGSARDVGAWAAVRVCRVDLEPVADAALRLRLLRLLIEGELRQQRAAAAARDLVAPAEGGAGRQQSAAGEEAGLVQAAERQRESASVRRHPYRVRVGAFQRPDRRQLVDERLRTGSQLLGGKAGAEVRRERGAVRGSAVGLQRAQATKHCGEAWTGGGGHGRHPFCTRPARVAA